MDAFFNFRNESLYLEVKVFIFSPAGEKGIARGQHAKAVL